MSNEIPTGTQKRTPMFTMPVSPHMLDAACAALPGVPRDDVSQALTAAMQASPFYVEVWGGGGIGQSWAAGGNGRGGSNAE